LNHASERKPAGMGVNTSGWSSSRRPWDKSSSKVGSVFIS
jgi:hypothetical protein